MKDVLIFPEPTNYMNDAISWLYSTAADLDNTPAINYMGTACLEGVQEWYDLATDMELPVDYLSNASAVRYELDKASRLLRQAADVLSNFNQQHFESDADSKPLLSDRDAETWWSTFEQATTSELSMQDLYDLGIY